MSPEAWTAVTVGMIGGFGVIISSIIKLVPRRTNAATTTTPNVCAEHSGVAVAIKNMESGLERVEKAQAETWAGINEIRVDVKALLKNGGH